MKNLKTTKRTTSNYEHILAVKVLKNHSFFRCFDKLCFSRLTALREKIFKMGKFFVCQLYWKLTSQTGKNWLKTHMLLKIGIYLVVGIW